MENLPPFPIMFEEWDLGTACEDIAAAWDNHGDIVVGNDVWIGYEAVILAGLKLPPKITETMYRNLAQFVREQA